MCCAMRRALPKSVRDTNETQIRVRVDLDAASDPQSRHRHRLFRSHARATRQARRLRAAAGLPWRPAYRRASHGRGLRAGAGPGVAPGAGGQARNRALRFHLADGRIACIVPHWTWAAAPYFVLDGEYPRERVGELSTEMVAHFFRSLCEALGANLHLRVRGENAHHMVEASFKVVARCLRQAIARNGERVAQHEGGVVNASPPERQVSTPSPPSSLGGGGLERFGRHGRLNVVLVDAGGTNIGSRALRVAASRRRCAHDRRCGAYPVPPAM